MENTKKSEMQIASRKVILFLFAFLLLFSLVSAVELKLVKVSELKVGDVIIDKNGNEVPVEKIETSERKTSGITGLIISKLYGNESEKLKAPEKIVGSAGKGPGALTFGETTGQVVYTPETETKLSLWEKIKGWFS